MDDRDLVRALKALADPKRFRMVQEIAKAGELSCGQVADRFHVSQPTISHHLKILVDAGVVVVRHEAKHHFLSVNDALVKNVLAVLPARLMATGRDASPKRRKKTPSARAG